MAIQPLGDTGVSNKPVAVVDHGPEGPIRCRRCKAYINPHVIFADGGRRFQCNFCNCLSEVPAQYFCNLDHTGRRIDINERPELLRGTVEYRAPNVCGPWPHASTHAS